MLDCWAWPNTVLKSSPRSCSCNKNPWHERVLHSLIMIIKVYNIALLLVRTSKFSWIVKSEKDVLEQAKLLYTSIQTLRYGYLNGWGDLNTNCIQFCKESLKQLAVCLISCTLFGSYCIEGILKRLMRKGETYRWVL